MSVRATAWAWDQRTTTPTQKLVLVALADRHNDDTGQCNPRIERVAHDTGLGESTVRRALAALVEMGLLQRDRKRRKDGSLGTYHYVFPLDQVASARTPPPRASGSPPGRASGQEPEVDLEPVTATTAVVAVAPQPLAPPKLVQINRRNLPFDALAEECGVQPGSPRVSGVVAALNGTHNKPGIRALAWAEIASHSGVRLAGDEAVETAIADLIRERAADYRRTMGDAMLTPTALLKWWVDLPHLPGRQGRAPDAMAGATAAAKEWRKLHERP